MGIGDSKISNSSIRSDNTVKLSNFYYSNKLISNNLLNKKFLDIKVERICSFFITKPSLKNNSILVVEDNKILRNSLIKSLKKCIYKLKMADKIDILEGLDGIDIIKTIIDDQKNGNKVKLIFSDENMEYMNGSQSVKFINGLLKDNKIKHIPKTICVTGFEDEDNNKMLLNNGFNIIIEKNKLSDDFILDIIKECFV